MNNSIVLFLFWQINGDEATGSGRCIDGMNLADCLNACSNVLLKHGGHQAAAGVTLKKENIPKFKKAFNDYATEHLTADALTPKLNLDFETDLSSLTLETLEQFEVLEPFWIGKLFSYIYVQRFNSTGRTHFNGLRRNNTLECLSLMVVCRRRQLDGEEHNIIPRLEEQT